MIGLVGKSVRRAAVIGLLALCAGCFEEKTTVTVHANGAGTVHVSRKFSEEFTTKNYASFPTDAEKQERASASFLKTLAPCQGIVAWSSAKGKIEGGRLVQDAVGYFEDLSKVRMTDVMGTPAPAPVFTWKKNPDGGLTVTWGALSTDDDGSKTFMKPRPTAEEAAKEKAGLEDYKGLSLERILVMPGKIATASSAFKDRSLSVTLTIEDIVSLDTFIADSWVKIDKKETTKEAATAAVEERIKKLSLAMTATCGPAADAAEAAAFEKELAKAKETYAGSELKKTINAK